MEGKIGRREQKKMKSREAILSAAAKLFEEKGYSDTSIVDITAMADLGTGTFYNYFKSKDEVLLSLLELLFEKIRTASSGLHRGMPAREVLESLTMCSARLVNDNRYVLPLFLKASEKSGEPIDRNAKNQAPGFREMFNAVLRYGQERGEFRKDIPADIVSEMIHAVFQTASFSHVDISFTENVKLKLELLLDGLKPQQKRE